MRTAASVTIECLGSCG